MTKQLFQSSLKVAVNHSFLKLSLVTALATAAFFPGSAFAQGRVKVMIHQSATLVNNGQAAEPTVTVHCAPGVAEVLEAFVYITRNGIHSSFKPIPVVCGRGPDTYEVIVNTTSNEVFKSGSAHASAYVLVKHPKTGRTTTGQFSGSILLQ